MTWGRHPGDEAVTTDLRTGYYRDAIALARCIILGQGRALHVGEAVAWSFLIPTPIAIESGVRRVLRDGLLDLIVVNKKGVAIQPSSLTLNPDLVFGQPPLAVGDVKYQLTHAEWARQHLYQAVTFACGFEVSTAVVVGFRIDATAEPPDLQVGQVQLKHLSWSALTSVPPDVAAQRLVIECARAIEPLFMPNMRSVS